MQGIRLSVILFIDNIVPSRIVLNPLPVAEGLADLGVPDVILTAPAVAPDSVIAGVIENAVFGNALLERGDLFLGQTAAGDIEALQLLAASENGGVLDGGVEADIEVKEVGQFKQGRDVLDPVEEKLDVDQLLELGEGADVGDTVVGENEGVQMLKVPDVADVGDGLMSEIRRAWRRP